MSKKEELKFKKEKGPKLVIPSPEMANLTEEYLIPALMDKVRKVLAKHIAEYHSDPDEDKVGGTD